MLSVTGQPCVALAVCVRRVCSTTTGSSTFDLCPPSQGALMGGLWGAGHNTGQIIFALVFLLLRDRLPFNLEAIESGGKALVGATLLLIGILARAYTSTLGNPFCLNHQSCLRCSL